MTNFVVQVSKDKNVKEAVNNELFLDGSKEHFKVALTGSDTLSLYCPAVAAGNQLSVYSDTEYYHDLGFAPAFKLFCVPIGAREPIMSEAPTFVGSEVRAIGLTGLIDDKKLTIVATDWRSPWEAGWDAQTLNFHYIYYIFANKLE